MLDPGCGPPFTTTLAVTTMTEPDWNVLIPELPDWNNGRGVDAAGWLSAMGNFQLACAYTQVFWPRFTLHDGMILREGFDHGSLADFLASYGGNKTKVEWVMNHLHILDIQHMGCPDASRERIVYLGRVLKQIYELKLASDFPGERIVVDFDDSHHEDLVDYQLSFYRKRDG